MSDRPGLDRIRIASPCSAGWANMRGDDRRRACDLCGRDVHDLTALTTAEALALVTAPGAPPCVRFYRRFDGTILTADCPVGVRAVRGRRAVAALATGLGLAAWALAGRVKPDAPGVVPPVAARPLAVPPVAAGRVRATVAAWADEALIALGIRRRFYEDGASFLDFMPPPPAPPPPPGGPRP